VRREERIDERRLMQPSYDEVERRINEIEAEMKSIGYWQDDPLPPEAYNFTRAFGGDTMAFSQWLQFIFILRVRSIIAEKGQFPSRSMVGAQAVREFDGDDRADRLVRLLNEFDALFDG
jgi:uncharacterized protein YqcC (DUF446 family)